MKDIVEIVAEALVREVSELCPSMEKARTCARVALAAMPAFSVKSLTEDQAFLRMNQQVSLSEARQIQEILTR